MPTGTNSELKESPGAVLPSPLINTTIATDHSSNIQTQAPATSMFNIYSNLLLF